MSFSKIENRLCYKTRQISEWLCETTRLMNVFQGLCKSDASDAWARVSISKKGKRILLTRTNDENMVLLSGNGGSHDWMIICELSRAS